MVYFYISTVFFIGGMIIIYWLHNQHHLEIIVEQAPHPGHAPLISVCIPARNEERNIRACVEAILDQDYPNFEVIMMRNFILILIGVLLLSACGAEKGIEIHSAWMRPAGQGENGAVYFVIHNHSSEVDELIGLSSDIAAAAEMHESKMSGDVMQMDQIESVPLEAFAEIAFAPGGLHIMLVDLKQDVRAGDEIEVILHFKNLEDIKVIVPVRETAVPEDHPSEDH